MSVVVPPGDEDDQVEPKPPQAVAREDEDEGIPLPENKADEPNAAVNVDAEYAYPETLNAETMVKNLSKTFKDSAITNPFDEDYNSDNKDAADEKLASLYSKGAKSLFQLARTHTRPGAGGLDNDTDIEREVLAAAKCFGPEIKQDIEDTFANAKRNGKINEFLTEFFENIQSTIDDLQANPVVKAYESTKGLEERFSTVRSSAASLSASVTPGSAAPLRISPEPTTLLADTAVCATENVLVTDKAWKEIKEAIKAANPSPEILEMSKDDNTIYLKKANIDIQRKEHGVQVSTTVNPPDHEALVKNYKIAAGILKQKTCLISSSPSAENTAKLILELTKEPSIKPVITDNKILQALKDSTAPECIEACSKLEIKKPKLKM